MVCEGLMNIGSYTMLVRVKKEALKVWRAGAGEVGRKEVVVPAMN